MNLDDIKDSEINDMVQEMEYRMMKSLDNQAPLKQKCIVVRDQVPWYTDEVKEQKRRVRRHEKVYRKYREHHQWLALKMERDTYKRMLKAEKKKVISEKVKDCNFDPKKLFNLVAYLTGTKKDNPLPESPSDKELANTFVDYFIGKIHKIRNELESFETYEPTRIDVPDFPVFEQISEKEVANILMKMTTKSCELDILPTFLLKKSLPKINKFLTRLVNISITSGTFPNVWKTAIVRPLLKKVGLETINSNYRPVSNLSCLSKLLEKAVLSQFNDHCLTSDLMPHFQSAYRPNHSCETALIKLMNDILWNMEEQCVTALVAIDLSAAFDTVDHNVLIKVLNKKFGLSNTALMWFESYLQPRQFKVCVKGQYSTEVDLKFSVPQGSCAGPTLYLAYASTIQEIIPKNIDIHGYTDDHVLKNKFYPSKENDEFDCVMSLEKTLVDVNEWMNQNRLKMNNAKTEYIMFGSSQQLGKCNSSGINVNGAAVERATKINYLGALLDDQLTLKQHITNKCKIAMLNLHRIKMIREYLDVDTCHTLVLGLVMSHLDYANSLYQGLPEVTLRKLQMVQNMAAKLVLNHDRLSSATEARKELHWLPI